MDSQNEYALLKTFRELFLNTPYFHRKSTLGDQVAMQLYEDLVVLNKSAKLTQRVHRHERVVNLKNTTIGKHARRGDGTSGEIIPTSIAITEKGFFVGRGPVATIEVGAETKILAKAMIKQIDRVIGDLERQVAQFKKSGGNPICVAFVGLNFAQQYTSYEGVREFQTDGKKHKHPFQEAPEAERRLLQLARPAFDEFQLLKFKASNIEPYPFEWLDYEQTRMEYGALLTRISREYDRRFP
jgi:hypothetical protein